MRRCEWVGENKLMINYHDSEWGTPLYDDRKLFEYLTLEAFQAGLSWSIVLNKRENFRKAFAQFDPQKIKDFGDSKVSALLKNEGIVRNQAKILATINNATQFIKIQKEFGSFSLYQWRFVNNTPIVHVIKKMSDFPTVIPEAVVYANDLKKRGFKFLGPTTLYAHMQAVGMVNDHMTSCFKYSP